MKWLQRLLGRRPPARDPVTRERWEQSHALARQSVRLCWLPTTENEDGPPGTSKFGGAFWMPTGEPWPICGYCGSPLQPFVQLSSSELPTEAGAPFTGLLQLFYCTAGQCDPGTDAWDGFGKNQLVRLIPAGQAGAGASFPGPDPIPPRRIVRWVQAEDFPGEGEVSHTWPEGWSALFYDHADEFGVTPFPLHTDKLLGWPDWVQNIEYVPCPDCQGPMRYIFQVASEDHVPYMFGDAGIGHISYCPDHPHRAAFLWACS